MILWVIIPVPVVLLIVGIVVLARRASFFNRLQVGREYPISGLKHDGQAHIPFEGRECYNFVVSLSPRLFQRIKGRRVTRFVPWKIQKSERGVSCLKKVVVDGKRHFILLVSKQDENVLSSTDKSVRLD